MGGFSNQPQLRGPGWSGLYSKPIVSGNRGATGRPASAASASTYFRMLKFILALSSWRHSPSVWPKDGLVSADQVIMSGPSASHLLWPHRLGSVMVQGVLKGGFPPSQGDSKVCHRSRFPRFCSASHSICLYSGRAVSAFCEKRSG
jgi:hypothetical protein